MRLPAPPDPSTPLGRAVAAALARDRADLERRACAGGGGSPQPLEPPRIAPPLAVEQPRRRKYGNTPVTIEGRRFDSKGEGDRYLVLRARELAGEIADLRCQPQYPLIVNGAACGAYVADFEYRRDGALVVEDWKCEATRTPVYRLKARLFRALYGLDVTEVGR